MKRYIDNGETPTILDKWIGGIGAIGLVCIMAIVATRIAIDLREKRAKRNASPWHRQLPTATSIPGR